MDFAIVMNEGCGEMTFDEADTIFNNVYLSWTIRKGTFFADPEFGSRFHLLKKNTQHTAALAEEYGREALQWLLETGRAVKIKVQAARDSLRDPSRLNLLAEVIQSDGRLVSFEHFVEVV